MSWDDGPQGFLQKLREFLYGLTMHESALVALRKRALMEHLFMVVTMGDMLGIPIVPQYYVLRLLPFALAGLPGWKHSMMREKDLTDKADFG